jgi:hypothetical protein
LPAVVFSGRSSNCGRFSSQFAAAICCQDDLCISSEASFPSAKICFDFSPILSRLPADSSQNYAAAGVLFVQILTTKAGIKAITERTLPPLHWPSPNCGCRHLGVLLPAPGVLFKIISAGLWLGIHLAKIFATFQNVVGWQGFHPAKIWSANGILESFGTALKSGRRRPEM